MKSKKRVKVGTIVRNGNAKAVKEFLIDVALRRDFIIVNLCQFVKLDEHICIFSLRSWSGQIIRFTTAAAIGGQPQTLHQWRPKFGALTCLQ